MPRIPFVVLVLLTAPFLAGCVAEDTSDLDDTPTPSPSPTASPTPSSSPTASPSPTSSPSPTPTDTQSPSPTPTPTPEGETYTVQIGANIKGFAADYDPDPVRIKVGDSVVWENLDSMVHTATADDDSFDTKSIGGGQSSTAIRFDATGTFTYFCKAHPNTMNGAEVIVEA